MIQALDMRPDDPAELKAIILVECALRPMVLTRNNALFAESNAGGETFVGRSRSVVAPCR